MTLEEFRSYCMTKKGVTEDMPFDEDTLVFRVGNKIFALTSVTSSPFRVNLKCDPELAEILREKYEEVIPGYHMNKKHWNTVYTEGSIPKKKLLEMIDMSYDLVFKQLPKKVRESIEKS